MRSNCAILVLIAITMCNMLAVPVPARFIKGTYQPLKQAAKVYSPLHGVSISDKWIPNMFKYGPSEHAMTKLINSPRYGLFARLGDTETIRESVQEIGRASCRERA